LSKELPNVNYYTYSFLISTLRKFLGMSEFISSKFPKDYMAVLSAALLVKSTEKSLWPDSIYVAKQLDGIGLKYAENLAGAGKTSFKAIAESNPRDLERVNSGSYAKLG